MSRIKDALQQAEEAEDFFSNERLKQLREETRKMDELAERWNGVYQTIDGVIGKGKSDED